MKTANILLSVMIFSSCLIVSFFSCNKESNEFCEINNTGTIWVFNNSSFNNIKVYIDNMYCKTIDEGEGYSNENSSTGSHYIYCEVNTGGTTFYWEKNMNLAACDTYKFTLTNK